MRVRHTVQLGLALPYQLSRAQEKESPSQQCIRELGMGEPFSGWPGSPQQDGGGKAGQAGRIASGGHCILENESSYYSNLH